MDYLLFLISSLISLLIRIIPRFDSSNVKSILAVRLDHLGDFALTLPSIISLRKKYPDALITIVIGSWNKDLAEKLGIADIILLYDSYRFRGNKNANKANGIWNLYKQLKGKKYDLVVGYRDDFISLFFTLLLFPKIRVDRGTIRIYLKLSEYFPRFRTKLLFTDIHECYTNLNITHQVGCKFEKWMIEVKTPNSDKIEMDEVLSNFHIGENFAIFHPGGKWIYRRWSESNFRELASYLFNKFKLVIVLIGVIEEIDICERISAGSGYIINLAGELTLSQTFFLIASAKLFVGNDSGPLHLASLILNKPSIALLGPQNELRFGPLGDYVLKFHKKLDCFPCDQTICKYSELPCVNRITVEEVKQSIEQNREFIKI